MILRDYWKHKIAEAWIARSIVWLSGVRRAGKTCLCKQLEQVTYLNCDLPSVRRQMDDPEFFLAQHATAGKTIVLDEVHKVNDPSLVLKIAADEFPDIKLLATGSSTLQATRKFRDTLTDRKRSVHLVPVLWRECLGAFKLPDLDRRLLHGGLPAQLLNTEPDPAFFEEWIDSFYARDIEELFGVRNRTGFLTLLGLVCRRSGGQLDISDLANQANVSRPTVMSHLDALEISHAVRRLPPYHGGDHREIVKQPRIYAYDTGLVAHIRGWERIREEDRGYLWEHLVLDELQTMFSSRLLHYWRDKSQHEIDFVVEHSQGRVDAVEAKINPDAFDAKSLRQFRELHPNGNNYVVCPFVDNLYAIRRNGLTVYVCRPDQIEAKRN